MVILFNNLKEGIKVDWQKGKLKITVMILPSDNPDFLR
jgi:hypothetical protein